MPLKVKTEPKFVQSSPVEQDSDIICYGYLVEEPIEISEEAGTQELFLAVEEQAEELITVQTQPQVFNCVKRRKVNYQKYFLLFFFFLKAEGAEIISRDALINILAGDSPVIDDSGKLHIRIVRGRKN